MVLPYHYAPFAADFEGVKDTSVTFDKTSTPFKPFEQLMAVLPSSSKHLVPEPHQELMVSDSSEIIDFYPEDFEIDLNGKKFTWQGIALLPFIDEERLKKALTSANEKLDEGEKIRNTHGHSILFVGENHPLYKQLISEFYSRRKDVLDVSELYFYLLYIYIY